MKYKVKRSLILFFSITFLVIIFVICFRYTNSKYSGYLYNIYNLNQTVDFDGINISFTNKQTFNDKEILNKYPEAEIYEDKQVNILLDMEICNTTNKTKIVDLSRVLLETQGWYSNISIYTFYSINNIESYIIQFEPGSKIKLVVPFTYFYTNKSEIKDIYNKQFILSFFNKYPNKNIIKI